MMDPQRPRIRLFYWLQSAYMRKLTPSGRIIFWILVLSSGLGFYSFTIKIYYVFIILFALFFVSFIYTGLFSYLKPPRLEVSHAPPGRSTCGHSVRVRIQVRNLSAKNYYDLTVTEGALPPFIHEHQEGAHYIPHLPPHGETSCEVVLEFTRRGHYVLPGIEVESSFPFGIGKGMRRFPQEKSLLVYPRFHHLTSLDIPVGKRYQPGGIALTSNLGESTEFICTREYRVGDSPRFIHWRSSARLGKPVVKEFQEEYFCRIALLLDTYVPPGSKQKAFESLEAAISLSAAVADNLSRKEYIIDIFAAGPNVYHLQAGRSLAYLENILDILACIEHCSTPPFEKLEPILLENLSQITTCIMVFLDWDEPRERLVRTARALGTAVKAIIVRDGAPSADPAPYEGLVGKIALISPDDEKRGIATL
ncbi:MAG: DUF58 domain-containing protein [Candidatus Eremiobacteraeota bacterium]|nr:DUF58 domain-containing protein [Candidatus Eremiobacteraeota bacterium]